MGDVTKLIPKGNTKPAPIPAEVLVELTHLIDQALERGMEVKLRLVHSSK